LLNGVESKLKIVHSAAGAEAGTLDLWIGEKNQGDHRMWNDDQEDSWQGFRTRETVEVATLDSIVGDVDAGLVWVDTQGFEGNVLAGSTQLMRTGVPFVLEYWPEGMRRAKTWGRFVECLTRANSVIDLRTNQLLRDPDQNAISELASHYPDTDTDLLCVFNKHA
jgi:FkbM family methyltransferase